MCSPPGPCLKPGAPSSGKSPDSIRCLSWSPCSLVSRPAATAASMRSSYAFFSAALSLLGSTPRFLAASLTIALLSSLGELFASLVAATPSPAPPTASAAAAPAITLHPVPSRSPFGGSYGCPVERDPVDEQREHEPGRACVEHQRPGRACVRARGQAVDERQAPDREIEHVQPAPEPVREARAVVVGHRQRREQLRRDHPRPRPPAAGTRRCPARAAGRARTARRGRAATRRRGRPRTSRSGCRESGARPRARSAASAAAGHVPRAAARRPPRR